MAVAAAVTAMRNRKEREKNDDDRRPRAGERLKVMHLWNTGGIGGLIARYMDRLKGTDSSAYMWDKWDPFELATSKTILYSTVLGKIKVPSLVRTARHYDIIHVHGLEGLTPWLKLLYPDKKIILHYHGTRIRGKWRQKKKFWRFADHILISTSDLFEGAPDGVIHVPNLIDWDTIYELKSQRIGSSRNGGINVMRDTAFHVSRWVDAHARAIARRYSLKLQIHDRIENPLPHKKFLELMAHYGFYIDIKRDFGDEGEILRAHSLTGIEAKALGLNVLNWDGEKARINIEDHRPDRIVSILWEVYNS